MGTMHTGFADQLIRAGTPTVGYRGHNPQLGGQPANKKAALAHRGGRSPYRQRQPKRSLGALRIALGLSLMGLGAGITALGLVAAFAGVKGILDHGRSSPAIVLLAGITMIGTGIGVLTS
ncbi:MAG: hypothetical protein PF961_07875 [Planctomycetota bacterium]|nr:hypothetical protein [Planctomycetota bacterium]